MAGVEAGFDQAGSAPLMPTVPEDQSAPTPAAKGVHGSTGACDACRLRKVRCLANESSLSSKCQRCARANRECVYTTHSKTRRRKRTDTRVKELEEKVRGLSMLLENGRGGSKTSSVERDVGGVPEEVGIRRDTPNELASLSSDDGREMCSWKKMVPPSYNQNSEAVLHEWGETSGTLDSDPMLPDVVDRGLLSMVKATELFNKYVDRLMPQYPAFPLSCTATELRRDKPILFLAVLAASVEASDPILNLKLNQEIQELYAKKIAIQGRKSLEIIQALCITILWTYPPKKFEELKFHQQIHMAATMALDIGLGKRSRAPIYMNLDPAENGDDPDHITSAKHRSSENSTLEGRRALLACYINCTSVSTSLRLPNMLRFTTWMSECVEVLETSPDAAPSDKRFAAWVKLQHIVEECFMSLGLDNPDDAVSLDEDYAQLALKGAEKQLSAWKKQAVAEPGVMNDFLEITYHTNNIYLHEIALHPDHDAEDFRPPFAVKVKSGSRKKLSPPYVNAIMLCLSSSQSLLEIFLEMEIDVARTSPTLVFVRVTYSLVVLMKLSISASAPSSELGKFLDSEDCKVLYFCEKLVAFMDAVVNLENQKKHVLAFKFLHIFSNLKKWFENQTLQLDANNGQKQQTDLKQDWDQRSTFNRVSIPQSLTTAMPSEYGAPSQNKDFSQYLSVSSADADFLSDPARSFIGRAYDGDAVQPTLAPLVPNGAQPFPHFQETDYSFMPSANSGPFEFPMEVDPNLFSQLVSTELYENSGGNVMLNGEDGMDYTDMPDIDWANLANWSLQ